MAAEPRTPTETYRTRLADRAAHADALDRRHDRLATGRLITTAAAAALTWGAAVGAWSWWWLAPPAALFAGLAIVHDRVLTGRDRARRAATVYRRGLARLDGTWSGDGATGLAFPGPEHPYAADLDLFGDGSLFQLLCTARLHAGEQTLAAWLLAPAPPAEIAARQAALEELRPRIDLREELALTGESVAARLDTSPLAAWGTQPRLLSGYAPRAGAALLGAGNVAALAASAFADASPAWPAASIAVSTIFAMAWRRRVHQVIASVNAPARNLRVLAEVLALIEAETVTTPRLAGLHDRLAATGDTASHRIHELTRLVDLLESRQNTFFAPVALTLLWGTQMAWAIEAWRARSGRALAEWIAVAGEFEALSALAGYAFEHPEDPFPEVVLDAAVVEGAALAHPLLPPARVVPNDVTLDAGTRVLVVSGSNMSGKSTLLRTVGVNVVLALAGAPVRAARLRVSPVALGATLRIQDSLQAGRSRFFAEITRLKQIVDLAAGPVPVLFLLDELLAGTNSHDRRLGAAGIVRGLVERGAIGLVTTHDLALAEVVSDLGIHARNVHFSDTFEGGEMRFDYRMRDGVVRTSNALALMRSIGLDVDGRTVGPGAPR